MMILTRLIYCSVPNGVGDADIQNILDTARANNALDNITGALVYNGTIFLQILEGGRRIISQRFISISRDNRHKDIEIIDVSAINERRFPMWTMGYVGQSSLDQTIVFTYSTDEFDPRRMTSPDAIVDMMWRLSQ